MENLQKLSLDIMNNHSYEYVFANQYDVGRTVEITITDDDEPMELTGVSATFTMLKPDGHYVDQPCTIDGSTVTFIVTAEMTAYPGKSNYQIVLNKDDITISTIKGTIIIEGAAVTDDTLPSGDESSMWNDMITRSDATEEYYNTMQAWIAAGSYDGSHGLIWIDSRAFSELPVSTQANPVPAGSTYMVNEPFITTSAFEGGAGVLYPAGTNVCWTAAGKWACLSGIQYHQNAATVPPSNGALLWGETYTPIIDDVTAYMAPTYSITELRVGTWLDGSDVFEQTYVYDTLSPSRNDWAELQSNVVLDILISISVTAKYGTRQVDGAYIRISYDNGKLYYYTPEFNDSMTDVYVTIRYTKPTTNNSSSNSESSQEGE